ncbi:MAG: phosphotransferase [Nostocoides sp.]
MERSPLALAALASAAVPGLDPVSVEAVPRSQDDDYDVAFVTDSEGRRWSIRAPRSAAAGARMEMSAQLLGLLARRMPFALPAPRGFVPLPQDGRAEVYATLPGAPINLAALPPGNGLAAELGRVLATIHNIEPAVYDEAGLPLYDADAYRARRLADLDRAATTGVVPSSLLSRWERALEDVSLWRFAATPIHGGLTGGQLLVTFGDTSDASTGRVRAVTGWEEAKVADPADDFAALVTLASPAAIDSVFESYAHARVERPDTNLIVRARLSGELALMTRLTRAVTSGWPEAMSSHARALEQLAADLRAHPGDVLAAEGPSLGTRPGHGGSETSDPEPDQPAGGGDGEPPADPAAPEVEASGVNRTQELPLLPTDRPGPDPTPN